MRNRMRNLRNYRLRSTSFFVTEQERGGSGKPPLIRSIGRSIKEGSIAGLIKKGSFNEKRYIRNTLSASTSEHTFIDLRKKYDCTRNEN